MHELKAGQARHGRDIMTAAGVRAGNAVQWSKVKILTSGYGTRILMLGLLSLALIFLSPSSGTVSETGSFSGTRTAPQTIATSFTSELTPYRVDLYELASFGDIEE